MGGAIAAPAQDGPPAARDNDALRGRLPPYYGDVVDDKQRAQIYKIQSQFRAKLVQLQVDYEKAAAQLKQLRKQLDSLQDEQGAAIDAVLTPQQVARVKQAQARAQARRAEEAARVAAEAAAAAQRASAALPDVALPLATP